MTRHAERRDKLRRALKKTGADALLVTSFTNVTYLTGFTGDDSYLLVRRDGEVVLSDPRYTTQLGEQCPGVELHIRRPGVSMLQAVVKVLRGAGVGRLAIEGDSMTVSLRDRIAGKLPKLEIVATTGLVETCGRSRTRTRWPCCARPSGRRRRPSPCCGRRCGRSRPRRSWPTSWRTSCGCSGPRTARSPRLRRWGRGRRCPTRRRGRSGSARGRCCWSIGGPTRGFTRAT